jgi:RimJ/RimL family protein N-acetyltransferase
MVNWRVQMNIEPITLIGNVVRLEPLKLDHVTELAFAGKDESIWRYMLYGNVTTTERMEVWVKELLVLQNQGTDLPFAVIHQATNHAIGATRYLNIRPEHQGVEIGGTWYGIHYQQTAVNTECKYLLLKHGFETWKCIRVEFKTDARNIRSRDALERIGARYEGTFRNHLITPNCHIRDSIYYSIIDSEWPAVKSHLEYLLSSQYK